MRKKPNINNIKHGDSLYYVHVLDDVTIVKYFVIDRPRRSKNYIGRNNFTIKVSNKKANYGYFSTINCGDANIDRLNCYNEHRVFFSKKKADNYARHIKSLRNKRTDMFNGFVEHIQTLVK